jgi:heterodisulfide reductase subunit A
LRAAEVLRGKGVKPVVVERDEVLGGKLNRWHCLFPSFAGAEDVLGVMARDFETVKGEAVEISDGGVTLRDGRVLDADAVVVATGFDVFPAERKEEYGYGIYDNVYTTADIEDMLRRGEGIHMRDGSAPRRVAFLHCVGSRDEKAGQRHCSRVCCITAVKQAIEVRELLPECEVFNFYMDMRMFGPGWEEMYRRAQEEHHIQFIRGRISEAGETIDKRIQIKAEDTLIGRPLKMTVDMLVLAVGMVAPANLGLATRPDGFPEPADPFTLNVHTSRPSVFLASTSPATLGETLNNASSAALAAVTYLRSL